MKINPQLIEWLKRNIRGQSGWMYVHGHDNAISMLMVSTLVHHNLIEFDMYDLDKPFIRYVLTPIGDIVMGIGSPAPDTAPTSEPQPVPSERENAVAGDMPENGEYYSAHWIGNTTYKIIRKSTNEVVRRVNGDEDAIDMVRLLDNETAALRSQLTSAQEQRDNAYGEIEAMRKRIEELGKQIDDAAYYLGQASAKDVFSNRAYNILKGYSQAED